MNKKKTFIIILVFWVVIIGSFIGFKEFTLRTGNAVLLKTVPVDPRDLFRGDYVVLEYEISTINALNMSYKSHDFKEKDKIYVLLNVDHKKIAIAIDIDKKKPKEAFFIQGTVTDIYKDNLSIEYGIESYFVPEGEGLEIERKLGQTYAEVAIDSFGKSAVKSLIFK